MIYAFMEDICDKNTLYLNNCLGGLNKVAGTKNFMSLYF